MDCVVFGAHPDDAEIFAGGFLALCARHGYDVGVVHMTRGERATRGTPEERESEAAASAGILGLRSDRVIRLDLGDTLLENTEQNRLTIVRVLREWRPRVVLHHYPLTDRHPDHRKAGQLVEDAVLYSRLGGIDTNQLPFAPSARFSFIWSGRDVAAPSLVVDISDTFGQKMEALRAYRSQFHNPDFPGPETYISSVEFLEMIETRARFYGRLIDARYGEPLWSNYPLVVTDPNFLFNQMMP
jgi:N-acetylglucosamine malate deacetylase 1